jgi:hypothetical protein
MSLPQRRWDYFADTSPPEPPGFPVADWGAVASAPPPLPQAPAPSGDAGRARFGAHLGHERDARRRPSVYWVDAARSLVGRD